MNRISGFIIICLYFGSFGSCQTPSEEFMHQAVLDSYNTVYLYWKYNETHITFEVIGKTNGWVGVGISPNGAMISADIYVGWVKNGKPTITDRHGDTTNNFPPIDPEQNVELLGGSEADGWTSIKFQRQIAACEDFFDRQITSDTTKVIWALGEKDPSGEDIIMGDYHDTNRGVKNLILLDNPGISEPSIDEKLESFEILNNDFAMPALDTYYNCKLFEIPKFTSKKHIVKVEPIIQQGNEALVHHMLLYQCTYKTIENASLVNTSRQCYTSMPADFYQCSVVFFAWAIGGGTFYYPKNAGLPLGDDDSPKYITIEIHYDNPEKKAGIIDNSGLKIYYTSQLRLYDASVLEIGHVVNPYNQLIPPKADSYLQYGECSNDCITAGLDYANTNELYFFGATLHSHLLGRKLTLKHIKNNGTEVQYISQDNAYDFNYQENRIFIKEKVFESGDYMQMVCDYNSKEKENFTSGGLGTNEEMCLAYVFYYPRIPVTRCQTQPIDTFEYFGITEVNFTGSGSIYDTLEDAIVKSPEELAGRTVASVANSINWNQEKADNFSQTMKNTRLYRFCETTKDIGVSKFLPYRTVTITDPYVPPVLTCLSSSNPVTPAPLTTTSSGSKFTFAFQLWTIVAFYALWHLK